MYKEYTAATSDGHDYTNFGLHTTVPELVDKHYHHYWSSISQISKLIYILLTIAAYHYFSKEWLKDKSAVGVLDQLTFANFAKNYSAYFTVNYF